VSRTRSQTGFVRLDRVHDGEEGGRGPDADRERDERHDGEDGTPPQHAAGVADVLDEALEPQTSPHLTRHLAHEPDVAELAACRRGSVVRPLPALDAIPFGHREMAAQLLVQLAFAVAPAEHHASLPRPLRTPPIASTSCSHRERSAVS
jgi:hypothetical protein